MNDEIGEFRVLSGWNPCFTLIALGVKNVENRKRPLPKTLKPPFWVAINATKTFTKKTYQELVQGHARRFSITQPPEMAQYLTKLISNPDNLLFGYIVGMAEIIGEISPDQYPLYKGKYPFLSRGSHGYIIGRTICFGDKSFPAKGKQTPFWKPSEEIIEKVREICKNV